MLPCFIIVHFLHVKERDKMNAARRKDLEKARGMIEEAKAILEQTAEGEREYYDNMPESMQSGDKGEKADVAASALEEAVEECDGILEKIETAAE
jgi:hypothetical protein